MCGITVSELAGVDEAKELFAEVLGLKMENIIMGGQSSLALMYDCIVRAWIFGVYGGSKPWSQQGTVKFLCPVPGYDRHFRITQEFGIEMINIPMSPEGPDMDLVREYVEKDASVKGIWCVPQMIFVFSGTMPMSSMGSARKMIIWRIFLMPAKSTAVKIWYTNSCLPVR